MQQRLILTEGKTAEEIGEGYVDKDDDFYEKATEITEAFLGISDKEIEAAKYIKYTLK